MFTAAGLDRILPSRAAVKVCHLAPLSRFWSIHEATELEELVWEVAILDSLFYFPFSLLSTYYLGQKDHRES